MSHFEDHFAALYPGLTTRHHGLASVRVAGLCARWRAVSMGAALWWGLL